jgi:hypothetical protein
MRNGGEKMSIVLTITSPDPDPWEAALWKQTADSRFPEPVFLAAWASGRVGVWWLADEVAPPSWRWELPPRMRPSAVREMFRDTHLLASVYHVITARDAEDADAAAQVVAQRLASIYCASTLPTYSIVQVAAGNAPLEELVLPGESPEAAARRLAWAAQDEALARGFLLYGSRSDIESHLYRLEVKHVRWPR